jgi:hypothetical protein
MTDQKPDPTFRPPPRDPDDEYTAGEFAGCEEPDIDIERFRRYLNEAKARKRRLNEKDNLGKT